MSTVVALGETDTLEGFALAGVTVIRADGDAVLDAWNGLGDEVGLVILTPAAAARLRRVLASRPDILTAVMP